MPKLPKALVRVFVVSALMKAVAAGIAKLFEGEATASDNDFKLLAVMDGRELDSNADSLRTGSATAVMGGIDIDLGRASLDPGGAHVALKAVMGGIRLLVPQSWRVDVAIDSKGGGVTVHTIDPAEADEDAPRLFVEAYARMGGIDIQPTGA